VPAFHTLRRFSSRSQELIHGKHVDTSVDAVSSPILNRLLNTLNGCRVHLHRKSMLRMGRLHRRMLVRNQGSANPISTKALNTTSQFVMCMPDKMRSLCMALFL
jgi:hypothetical protein